LLVVWPQAREADHGGEYGGDPDEHVQVPSLSFNLVEEAATEIGAEPMSEEQQYWRRLIEELQQFMTVAQIADEVGVEPRQVWRWKDGDRPLGRTAIRVYTLHVKRCPQGQCPMSPIAESEK
jgi:hypothetical protein